MSIGDKMKKIISFICCLVLFCSPLLFIGCSKEHIHQYSSDWTIDKEATDSECGSKSHHCTIDGCDEKTDITEIPINCIGEGMKIIWHGTASIEMVNDTGRILFDPFIPLEGSEIDVSIDEFDGFTDILITHGHFDHIIDLPEIYERNNNVMIHCTETPYNTLKKMGVPEENLHKITYGDVLNINGFKITAYHGKHAVVNMPSTGYLIKSYFSKWHKNVKHVAKVNKKCQENDESLFYKVEYDGLTVCTMGSLNLRDEIEYPTDCNLLLLPYNGWKNNFTPAKTAIERLKPKKVILTHYDSTFPPFTQYVDTSPIINEYNGLVEEGIHHSEIILKK